MVSLTIMPKETYGADDFWASIFGKRQPKAAAKPSPIAKDEKRTARSLVPQADVEKQTSEKRPDNCEPLKALGCIHMEGKCAKEHVTSGSVRICLEYEHKYKCPVTTSYAQRGAKGLPTGYCMTGDCLKTTRSSNNNMLDALSKLEALKQIQKSQMGDPIKIFTGEALSCTTNFGGSFKDCCGGMDGLGLTLKLATSCTADEDRLAAGRGKGCCVFIGSIKKDNPLDINFSKKYVYCCFPTKLSRIFQEQGRRQLGLSFGTPENPNCRGLTIDELQRIDMSKINFQEVFA